jgi:hypothetical protein
MSAVEALAFAERAGVSVRLDGDMLRLVAAVEPPADVLTALKAAKSEIVALLRREEGAGGQDGQDSENDIVARILIDLDACGFSARLWEDGALLLRDRWRGQNRPRCPPPALEDEFWARADAIARWIEEGGTI